MTGSVPGVPAGKSLNRLGLGEEVGALDGYLHGAIAARRGEPLEGGYDVRGSPGMAAVVKW